MIEGVTTILSAETQTVRMGEPINLTMTLKYDLEEEIPYDDQGIDVHDNYTVIDPDGNQAPFIGGIVSTASFGQPKIKPNTTITLFSGMDLTDLYLIDQAGKYTIAFRGYRGQLGRFGHYPPSSNKLIIDVAKGEISPEDKMVRQLLAICPESWCVAQSKQGARNMVSLNRQKASGIYASFQHKWGEHVGVYQIQKRIYSIENSGDNYKYLGQGQWGHVYIRWGYKTEEAWPTFMVDISDVLVRRKWAKLDLIQAFSVLFFQCMLLCCVFLRYRKAIANFFRRIIGRSILSADTAGMHQTDEAKQ
ncbi:hypothetical protein JXA32_08070 [Candidatus Sumerlaeota bacterium]|nr:hypothetical protein [Candidatus Sumerlaeota bacterium]